jgi:hypothetical protein
VDAIRAAVPSSRCASRVACCIHKNGADSTAVGHLLPSSDDIPELYPSNNLYTCPTCPTSADRFGERCASPISFSSAVRGPVLGPGDPNHVLKRSDGCSLPPGALRPEPLVATACPLRALAASRGGLGVCASCHRASDDVVAVREALGVGGGAWRRTLTISCRDACDRACRGSLGFRRWERSSGVSSRCWACWVECIGT